MFETTNQHIFAISSPQVSWIFHGESRIFGPLGPKGSQFHGPGKGPKIHPTKLADFAGAKSMGE